MNPLITEQIKKITREQASLSCLDFRSDIWTIIWEIVDEIADSIPNHVLIKNKTREDLNERINH